MCSAIEIDNVRTIRAGEGIVRIYTATLRFGIDEAPRRRLCDDVGLNPRDGVVEGIVLRRIRISDEKP